VLDFCPQVKYGKKIVSQPVSDGNYLTIIVEGVVTFYDDHANPDNGLSVKPNLNTLSSDDITSATQGLACVYQFPFTLYV